MQGQRLHKVQKTEPTFEQRIEQAKATAQELRASMDSSFRSLRATFQRMEASAQVLTAPQHRIAERPRYQGTAINFWYKGGPASSYGSRKDVACIECSLDFDNSPLSSTGCSHTGQTRHGLCCKERCPCLHLEWHCLSRAVRAG